MNRAMSTVLLATILLAAGAQAAILSGASASASSTLTGYGDKSPNMAIDNNRVTHWHSVWSKDSPQWFRLDYSRPVMISGYSLSSRTAEWPTLFPNEWIFQGSADGQTWVDLDTRTGYASATEELSFDLPVIASTFGIVRAQGPFIAVRWHFNQLSSSDNYACLSEVKVRGTEYECAVQYAGGTPSASTTLTGWGDKSPARARDGDLASHWHSTSKGFQWYQLTLDSAKFISGYGVAARSMEWPTQFPNAWDFQGTTDGAHWVTIDSVSGVAGTPNGNWVNRSFGVVGPFTAVRLVFTGLSYSSYACLGEMVLTAC